MPIIGSFNIWLLIHAELEERVYFSKKIRTLVGWQSLSLIYISVISQLSVHPIVGKGRHTPPFLGQFPLFM